MAEQQAHTYRQAQSREAEALAQHMVHVEGRPCACTADAEAASAAYAGRLAGQGGRPACRWHSHDVRDEVQTQWACQKRAQRGRPPKDEPLPHHRMERRKGAAPALGPPVATCGWRVLATTVREQTCSDAEMVRAYRDQTTTVEPGCRWIKHPAASSPVWREKPQRIAALAMLTGVGLLGYSLIQRQVRQYLQQQQQSSPGNKGETAMPTATVVLESFTQVTLERVAIACMAHSQYSNGYETILTRPS